VTVRTQISTTIDYDKPGKQQGYLALPYSDNEAGWANIFIPITVVQHGTGPTLLATGATHGDEFEGCVALMKLARDLQPEHIQGRAIIIPALNLPAARAGTRLSPIDGRNLNRAFPGSYNDTTTGLIAHYVSSVLFPVADVVMDIHSGGKSMLFLPCTNLHRVLDDAQFHKMLAAARVWGSRYAFIYADVAGEGLLPVEAERMGKLVVTTEMGGAGQCSPEVLRIAETGIRNIMIHVGLMAGQLQGQPDRVEVIAAANKEDYHFSPADGIYESFHEVGARIEKGQRLGQVHFVERYDRPPEPVIAQTSGILVCRRFPARIRQGDCAATIAAPVAV
jgi:N-alpha-acetyl-L-2,4-diaminobutyrate deacetylase